MIQLSHMRHTVGGTGRSYVTMASRGTPNLVEQRYRRLRAVSITFLQEPTGMASDHRVSYRKWHGVYMLSTNGEHFHNSDYS